MNVHGPRPTRHLTPEERRKIAEEVARREEIYKASEELRSTSDQRTVVDRHHRELHDSGVIYGTETIHRTTALTGGAVLFTQLQGPQGFTEDEQSKIVESALRPKHQQLEQRVDLTSGVSVVEHSTERALEILRPDGVTRRYEETHIERMPYDGESSLVLSQWTDDGLVQEIAPNGTIFLVDKGHGAYLNASDRLEVPQELQSMRTFSPSAYQANTYVITPQGQAFGFEFRIQRESVPAGKSWPPGTVEVIRVPARVDDQGVLHVDRSQVPPFDASKLSDFAEEHAGGSEQLALLLRPDELQGNHLSPEAVERYQRPANEEIVRVKPQTAGSAGIQEQGGQIAVGGVRIRKRSS